MILAILAAYIATATQPCPQFFAGGLEPRPTQAIVQICYDGYSLGHDATVREPRYSAEHLTSDGVAAALKAKRFGAFHPEPLLPKSDRAELSDYLCAGDIDRGHMTNVGDFGTPSQENDTFTLANMIPQNDTLNEGLWAGLEGAIRDLAIKDGELYVVTGPAIPPHAGFLKGRVAVPSAVWKAVYDPKTGAAEVIVAANDATGHWAVSSIADAFHLIGFDPMPGAPASAKAVASPMISPLKGNSVLKPRTCSKVRPQRKP